LERTLTRLQIFIDKLGLKTKDITDEAGRISLAAGMGSISRQHLLRLRQGRASATAERIYIIVAAMQSLTGMMIRATDLFVLQPAMPGGAPLPWEGPRFFSPVRLPVSSRRRNWNRAVTEDSHPADAQEFEELYTEYGVLLRSIAMRRYNIPPDDAEALVHDIFTSYLQRRTYVLDVKPWLAGAIGNASKDYLRRRRREEPLLPQHEEIADHVAEEQTERWIVNMTAATVIARLGEKCRDTLRSYYFNEESKESIAHRLATSPGYVLQLLVSCRRRVRAMYDSMRPGK
jgi:RNA polymerase sigma factor (sigma-70 family)